jgi:hypothetical protein
VGVSRILYVSREGPISDALQADLFLGAAAAARHSAWKTCQEYFDNRRLSFNDNLWDVLR